MRAGNRLLCFNHIKPQFSQSAVNVGLIRPVAKGEVREGSPGPPQAIQGIVNTLFWLCGFNFSESKIIVIHKALRNLQLETVMSNRYDWLYKARSNSMFTHTHTHTQTRFIRKLPEYVDCHNYDKNNL